MAKIPTGEFGFRVPQGNDVTPMPALDTQVSDAATRLGSVATQIGGNILAEQAAEQKRKDLESARRAEQVQTLTAHANIQNGLTDSYDAINSDVLSGKVDKIEALANWKDASQKVVSDNLKAVPPDLQPVVGAQVVGLQGSLQNKLFDTFRKRDQQDVTASIGTYREQMQRFAQTDPDGAVKQFNTYVDQMGGAAGMAPDVQAKAKQGFAEQTRFGNIRAGAASAYDAGSIQGLEDAQKRLDGPEGDILDPNKKTTLQLQISGWKNGIQAKQDRDAANADRIATKNFNTATDSLNQFGDLLFNGHAASGDFISDVTNKVIASGDTGLQARLKDMIDSQRQVSGFAAQSAPARAALIAEEQAKRSDPKVGTDPASSKRLDQAVRIDDSIRKQASENPWGAAAGVGVVKSAPAMNIGNPQQALAVFQQRAADQPNVEAWVGHKVSPLQPAEAEQFTKLVRTLKPDQAASMLGQIGAVVGDQDRIAAVAKQIGDKDGTLGMAMMYANAKTTEGRYTAELILQGEQAIRDKTVKPDGAVETGWRGDIAKKVRGAYSNQEVEDHVIDAAFKIAAAKGGDTDNAINLATGGIIDHNGGKVPLPYGMKEPEFDKRLAAVTPDTLTDQAPGGFVQAGPAKVPLADFVKTLPDARLVHAGQGLYNVRAGNTLVTNERGQRITIKVGP